jgi:hypothetical protein
LPGTYTFLPVTAPSPANRSLHEIILDSLTEKCDGMTDDNRSAGCRCSKSGAQTASSFADPSSGAYSTGQRLFTYSTSYGVSSAAGSGNSPFGDEAGCRYPFCGGIYVIAGRESDYDVERDKTVEIAGTNWMVEDATLGGSIKPADTGSRVKGRLWFFGVSMDNTMVPRKKPGRLKYQPLT